MSRLHLLTGDLAAAEVIWEDTLAMRLPLFQEARRRRDKAFDAVRKRALDAARAGHLPQEIDARLEKASESERPEIFGAYLRELVDKNAGAQAAQQAYGELADVVPISVSLGMAKLRRANEATGEERQTFLGAAERAFLAISEAAEGLPEYHLGLGRSITALAAPTMVNGSLLRHSRSKTTPCRWR